MNVRMSKKLLYASLAALGLGIGSLAHAAPPAASCDAMIGTYINPFDRAVDADTGQVNDTSALMQIQAGGNFLYYNSGYAEGTQKIGIETSPTMGSWKCINGEIHAVALDYFSYGVLLGGKPVGFQKWDEYTRRVFIVKPGANADEVLVKGRLIGILKDHHAQVLNADVPATVASPKQDAKVYKRIKVFDANNVNIVDYDTNVRP